MGLKAASLHPWRVSPAEAEVIQQRLRTWVVQADALGAVRTVAGVDLGFTQDAAGQEVAQAAVAVLSFPQLTPVDHRLARRPVEFPYIPGLLAFRELPAVLEALAALDTEPDLLIVDGQGLAHPRRCGIASHLGLLLDRPTIGCAKTRLWGHHDEPGPAAGDYAYLVDRGEIIGAALRTRPGASPVFVSVGHKISLATAMRYVLDSCRGYRLPEPIRHAHRLASGQAPQGGAETWQTPRLPGL